jgi:hypothetical protein
LGIALGFVVPASVVRSDKDPSMVALVGNDLYNMFLTVAIFTTVLLVVIIIGECQRKVLFLKKMIIVQSSGCSDYLQVQSLPCSCNTRKITHRDN